MKKQVIAVIMSIMVSMGSIGSTGVPARAAEMTSEEASATEENRVEEGLSEEAEDASTGVSVNEISEETSKEIPEENFKEISEEIPEETPEGEKEEKHEDTDAQEGTEDPAAEGSSQEMTSVTEDIEGEGTEPADDDTVIHAGNTEDGQGQDTAGSGDAETTTDVLEEGIPEGEMDSADTLKDALASSDEEGIVDSGTCGDSVTWTFYSNGLLKIEGSGKMKDYSTRKFWGQVIGTTAPWDKYDDQIVEVIVSDGVTRIGDCAFSVIQSITKAELPDSVTELGDYSFYRTDLSSLALPANLKTIGAYSLSSIESLLEIRIPEGVISVGRCAFYEGNFRIMWLPSSLTEIADNAFYYVLELTTVYYAGTEEEWKSIQIGSNNECLTNAPRLIYAYDPVDTVKQGSCGESVFWSLDENGVLTISGTGGMDDFTLVKFQNGGSTSATGYDSRYSSNAPWAELNSEILSIIVEPGVTHIGNAAFYNCYKVSSISLPDTLLSIGTDAFRSMRITSVTIPDNVQELGKMAFYGCYWLNDVKLSAGLSTIPDDCFNHCENLKTVVVPSGVTTIERRAFSGTGITDLTVPATVTKAMEYMGLDSGYGRQRTIRFLGALPQGLYKSLLTIADVTCNEEYYEEYRDYMLPYMLPLNVSSSSYIDLCTLTAGDISASFEHSSYSFNENKMSEQIVINLSGSSEEGAADSPGDEGDDISVTWGSGKEDVIRITEEGVAQASGKVGNSVVYAEVSKGNAKKLLFCKTVFKYQNINAVLLQTMPTKDILPNLPATSSGRLTTANEGIVSYSPALYLEKDQNNELYKELLDLTNSLTEGCTSDKQKVMNILTWVRNNITGSLVSLCIGETPGQVYTVYLNKEGNCQGFSKLTGFMFSLAEIPNAIISNSTHMWNAALLDGEWVMLDAQLGVNAFYADYSSGDYTAIENIFFSQGDLIFAVDAPGEVKLAGVGKNATENGREEITSINVPGFVTEIFGYACEYCQNLETVIIQEGTRAICRQAFAHCSNLASVTIPSSVTEIADNAFEGCSTLTIRGYSGSFAETYAMNKKIPFISLCRKTGEEHDFSDWSVTRDATCTEDGSRKKTCAACGDEVTEAIPANGHTWNTEYTVDKEPSKTEDGSKSIHCSVCDAVKEGSVVSIPKLTKELAGLAITGIVNATCTGKEITQELTIKDGDKELAQNTDYTVTYQNNVNAGTATITIQGIGGYTGTITETFTILPGKTTRGDMFNLANNVKVTWKEVPGAKYYKVYREGITDSSETRQDPVIVTDRLVGWDKQPGLTNGHAYRYKIVASLTGKGDPSGDSTLSYSKLMYRLKTVVIRSVKNTAPGKVTVKYDKTASGDSYVLQYCEREDMVGAKTKVVLGANNTSYTIGGLKKGKTYYVSIRVRKKVKGIDYYTTFGVPKKVTISK